MSDARSLQKQFNRMLATLLVALAAAGAVTYAWYIYNANRHITDVKMAAARALPSSSPTNTTASTRPTPV